MRLPPLLLTLALLAPAAASAGPLRGVTTCDLRRLTAVYGTQAKAKRTLRKLAKGSKIMDTPRGPMADGVYWEVEAVRKIPAECTFAEAGYDYDDSVVLARVWGTDPAGARRIVEQKISYGEEDVVLRALSGEGEEAYGTEEAALGAFLASDVYTYCDARLLAAHWQTDVLFAKIAIGSKLLLGSTAALESAMGPARQEALGRRDTCAFWETGYTYEDAAWMAAAWRTSVESAKARIGDMVLRGQNLLVRRMLNGG